MHDTITNFFSGAPLNRLSWLRPSHSFLNAIVDDHSRTKWILFNSGKVLLSKSPSSESEVESGDRKDKTRRSGGKIAYLTTEEVRPFVGRDPLFGQGKGGADHAEDNDSNTKEGAGVPTEDAHAHAHFLEAARHQGAPLVFLGLQEPTPTTNPTNPTTSPRPLLLSDFKDRTTLVGDRSVNKINGTPYFAIDVTELEGVDEVLRGVVDSRLGGGEEQLEWVDFRSAMMGGMDGVTAAIAAEASSMVDWNRRNKFCPACGSRCYSMWGGWKIACSSLLPWTENGDRKPCPTAKGLHNFTHPRTDAVVIMVAIDESGDNLLLGRNKKFPQKAYSALAGFIEPGESFEDAVKREMMEEAGVKVWNVKYHSGQPWPYPANLMVGFYAIADPTQPVRTDLDNELEDAQWFSRETILSVLNHPLGTLFIGRDTIGGNPDLAEDEPPFRIPPMSAIAGVLIRDWAEGRIGPIKSVKKGNL